MNLDEWHETGDRFNWRGQQVFYQEAGEGDVVFLLHGFLTSSWIYKYLWPTLSQHYRVVAPDYVGFGFSSKPQDYDYGMDERVDLIYALADLLSIKKCHIIAASFSASITQELLARQLQSSHSLTIQSAVFLNGVLFSDKSITSVRQKMMLTPIVGKTISKLFGRRTFESALGKRVGKYTPFPKDLMEDLFVQLQREGGLDLLHAINQYIVDRTTRKERLESAIRETNVPIQLIWGIDKEDQIAGLQLVHEYRKIKGDQYVVMLKDIGHFPMVEAPDMVLKYFLSFMDGLDMVSASDLPE